MDKLYIVMPAYNEEENIEAVVAQWHPVVEKIGKESRLVVMDDGSKDHTYERLRRLQDRYPQLTAVTKPNEGHGGTVLRAYRYAIERGADYIFQTDSDGQTLPEEFWPLWANRHKGGLQIGQRRNREDGASRVSVTRVLRLVLFAVFKVWVTDANTPFRLMKAAELKEVLEKIPEGFNLSNVIMTVVYEKKKAVVYYPITFRPRQGGVNSINLRKISRIGWQAVKDFRKIRREI
ncbi:MAG: glycosyltransferase family 2 protein [Blautia sp.]